MNDHHIITVWNDPENLQDVTYHETWNANELIKKLHELNTKGKKFTVYGLVTIVEDWE